MTKDDQHVAFPHHLKFDRLVLGSTATFQRIPKVPGFTTATDSLIGYGDTSKHRDARYKRCREEINNRSGSTLSIYYQLQVPFIADKIRVVLRAHDEHDISVSEINALRQAFDPCVLRVAEFAFDFIPNSGINHSYVEAHGKFGKSRRLLIPGHPDWLYFGDRKSSKLVRSYFKPELGVYRIELELHNRLIRNLGLSNFRSFSRLSGLLVPDHIRFVRIDWEAIERFCNRHNIPTGIIDLAQSRRSLHAQLQILQVDAHILNLHRFLIPLRKNRYLRLAMEDFVARYEDLSKPLRVQ